MFDCGVWQPLKFFQDLLVNPFDLFLVSLFFDTAMIPHLKSLSFFSFNRSTMTAISPIFLSS